MESKTFKIIMLCGNGLLSKIMYHGLADSVECVLVENKSSFLHIIKRR